MPTEWVPVDQFRSLTITQEVMVLFGWVIIGGLLFLGIADSISSVLGGFVIAVVATTPMIVLWINELAQ